MAGGPNGYLDAMTTPEARPAFHNERNTEDPDVETVELDDDDGEGFTVRQQNVGPGNELGGGEFPDRGTPPADEADAAPAQDALEEEARRAGQPTPD
jgi:hypothetical protein